VGCAARSASFKILDSQWDHHIVQIFSKDETTIYATILAIPNYRLKATNKTVITFSERPADESEALRAWFYAAALADPLSSTSTLPIVTIGDIAAQVTFSGLAPGFAGLYQVNALVPDAAPSGDNVNLVIRIGGVSPTPLRSRFNERQAVERYAGNFTNGLLNSAAHASEDVN
jgi:hypothetical protein